MSIDNIVAVPISLADANRFVAEKHRHHNPVHRDKFRVAAEKDGQIVGVANVGRPVNRVLDDGKTLEVLRLASDGTKNVCTFLYSRCARIAKELGYTKIVTYILESEPGTSLKASGWHLENPSCGGGSWDTPSRERFHEETDLFGAKQKYPVCQKQRWAKEL